MQIENLKLKLSGTNLEDIKTISAYLQDSFVTIEDIVFLKKNKIFLMLVSRFMWEDTEKGLFRELKRIKSAVKFSNVIKVFSKKIDQKRKKRILEFLAMKAILEPEKNCEIKLIFSGGSIITIIAENIDITLDDQGIPWKVKSFPKHKI